MKKREKNNQNSKQKSTRRRVSFTMTRLYMGLALIVIVVIIIMLLVFLWYSQTVRSFKPGTETVQYSMDEPLEYSADALFKTTDDGIVVEDQGEISDSTGLPLIYADGSKIVLMEDMLMWNPDEGKRPSRLLTYTTIQVDGSCATLEYNGKHDYVYSGYLFDGEETYVFLENTTLSYGSVVEELGPMSYAYVVYNKYLVYYNTSTEKAHYVTLMNQDVYAEVASGTCLNLGTDVQMNDSGDVLLYSTVEDIDVREME